jgi:hypothetical protein
MKTAAMASDPHRGAWLDRLGVSASVACAIHCAALTVALAVSPALWLRQRIGGIEVRWLLWLEWGLAATSIGLALGAGWLGWRRHGQRLPLLLLALGAALLLLGVFTRLHFVPYWGTAVVVAGGACLVAGHWRNLRCRDGCLHG